jgi:ribonuclease P protein component
VRERVAITVAMERLTRRTDFRAASSGVRAPASAFVLQVRSRGDRDAVRVGFTVSRQVGNAVERNRVRRRLREIVRLTAGDVMRAGCDYVLIGRRAALALPFAQMRQEFDAALDRVHDPEYGARAGRGGTGGGRQRPLHEAGAPRPRPRRRPRKA